MKKYNFNEKELLSLFVASDNELREVLKKPYTNNGFVFASDSHIMIRINPKILSEEYPECPKLRLGFPKNDLCPLQLETINRAITLWSNEGDTVLTPFLGIGSEVYQSIKLGRFGIGFELKESYFNEAIKNCKQAEQDKSQKQLFEAV